MHTVYAPPCMHIRLDCIDESYEPVAKHLNPQLHLKSPSTSTRPTTMLHQHPALLYHVSLKEC